MTNSLESKFSRVLASFKATLTPDEAENFHFVTLDDLKQTVADIQAEQGSKKRLQNLRRLDAFLEAMEQYDKVVQIFLNSADLLAYIWGPAKFMLMTASTWSESLNTLLDAYQDIGDHIPLLHQYEELIKRSPQLHVVLESIYKDILSFHQRAMRHFKNKIWKQLFHATWKTFRTDFKAVLESLRAHRRLLDSQAILVGVQESQKIRKEIEDQRQQNQSEEETLRRVQVFTWLAAADSAEDQETAMEARSKYPSTGHWILQESLVTQWCDPYFQTEPCLWINGKPGAGKTVLASVLVENCRNISNSNVAYFYCRAEDDSRNTFIGVCRSLICQLVQRDTSILSYAYEKSSYSGRSQLDSMSLAKEMLGVVLNAFKTLFIIIDGIDECKKVEKERISSALTSVAESHDSCLRCCFISQHDKDTGRIFRSMPTLKITKKHNKGDILDYCVGMEKTIARSFQVSAAEIQRLNISHNVAAKADGMFLFAKLVMENLLQQCTRAGLEAEIERIPPDLNKAYNRLLVRILHDAPEPEQQVAKKLLCWLLFTKRPLKWHEIQGAMAIDTEKLIFDYQGRSLIKDSKTFCGSLVEVRKGGTVELVHQTARSFLEKREELPFGPEEVNFTCICLGNLSLRSLNDDISEKRIRRYIQKGYYGLTDYAVVYWRDHLDKIISGKALDHEESLKALSNAIRLFLDCRFRIDMEGSSQSAVLSTHLSRFEGEDFHPLLIQAMESTGSEQCGLVKSSKDSWPVLAQLLQVRAVLEDLVREADPNLKEHLWMLYGPNLFKCSKPRCRFFHEGYATASERDAHKRKHKRAFFCTYPGCVSAFIGFATSTELKKHDTQNHGAAVDESSFPWNGNVASIDIEKQIKDGNLPEVQAWADQWEAQIPAEKLWFSNGSDGFDTSLLGLAIAHRKADVFETLLFQSSDELLQPANAELDHLKDHQGFQVFSTVMLSSNKKIATTYLKQVERVDETLFLAALACGFERDMINLLLYHAPNEGDRAFQSNVWNMVLNQRNEKLAKAFMLHFGLLEETEEGRRSSFISDLAFAGEVTFLKCILPQQKVESLINTVRLHEYCSMDDHRAVTALLESSQIKPNLPDSVGHTALIKAIHHKNFWMIRKLVGDHRVIVDAHQDDQAMSALHWALVMENIRCLEMLLNAAMPVGELTRFVLIDGVETTAIEYSKKITSPNIKQQLEQYRDAYSDWSLYPMDSRMLIRFCAIGDLGLVQTTLQRAPQELNIPDSRGVTPFLQAVKCGHHLVVQFLLGKNCDTQVFEKPDEISPLMFSVMRDDPRMVRLLFSKAKIDPTYENVKGETALRYLKTDSPAAEQIRDEIKDAIDIAMIFAARY